MHELLLHPLASDITLRMEPLEEKKQVRSDPSPLNLEINWEETKTGEPFKSPRFEGIENDD